MVKEVLAAHQDGVKADGISQCLRIARKLVAGQPVDGGEIADALAKSGWTAGEIDRRAALQAQRDGLKKMVANGEAEIQQHGARVNEAEATFRAARHAADTAQVELEQSRTGFQLHKTKIDAANKFLADTADMDLGE